MSEKIYLHKLFKTEQMRDNVENIQTCVAQIKRLYATILASPNADDSIIFFNHKRLFKYIVITIIYCI
jgi:hypothetical protein